MTAVAYAGSELELFAGARNWKRYLLAKVAPHLGDEVLEVGAGMGAFTRAAAGSRRRWVCVEPDPAMHAGLRQAVSDKSLPAGVEAMLGGLEVVPGGELFDSVVYIDVLEHVEDDRGEMQRAFDRLRPGGRLVVLAPAHQSLYSPFDQAIGHFRRYDARSLAGVAPAGAAQEVMSYLDSAGLFASLANKLLLKRSMPTKGQIAFWDGVLVRVSRVIDPLVRYRLGKSLLGVWRRP
jgi:SAM-dependent methyltransferase